MEVDNDTGPVDYRKETILQRQRIQELEAQLKVANNTINMLQYELDKKVKTMDVISKELSTKRHALDNASGQMEGLSHDLKSTQNLSDQLMSNLKRKQNENAQLSNLLDTPSTQYMHCCFEMGITPNPKLLKSLHHDPAIQCPDPLTYEELNALVDVMNTRSTINTSHWREFDSLSFTLVSDDCYPLLSDLILGMPSLTRLQLFNASDRGLQTIFATLQQVDWISSLSLPNSTMGDTTVLMLFDTVQQRQNFQDSIPRIATAQGVVALRDSTMQTSIMTGPDQAMLPQQLFMAELDLRNVVLQVETFGVIRSPVLRTLSLENQECLTDPCLHGILTGCPVLQVLNLNRCTGLTNVAMTLVNKLRPNIFHVALEGCPNITEVCLNHVTKLNVDWYGTLVLQCPKLTEIPTRITSFALQKMDCPQLCRLHLLNISLSHRELSVLAEGCAKSLVELAVPGCRLTNISRLTSHTRRLQNLSFHSAKGIKDADMDALPSTLVWLDLSYCFFLTDVGIAKLADRCPNLISLSLKGCSNLTDEALAALGRGCLKLKELNLLQCKKCSISRVERLVSAGVTNILFDGFLPLPGETMGAVEMRLAQSGARSPRRQVSSLIGEQAPINRPPLPRSYPSPISTSKGDTPGPTPGPSASPGPVTPSPRTANAVNVPSRRPFDSQGLNSPVPPHSPAPPN